MVGPKFGESVSQQKARKIDRINKWSGIPFDCVIYRETTVYKMTTWMTYNWLVTVSRWTKEEENLSSFLFQNERAKQWDKKVERCFQKNKKPTATFISKTSLLVVVVKMTIILHSIHHHFIDSVASWVHSDACLLQR